MAPISGDEKQQDHQLIDQLESRPGVGGPAAAAIHASGSDLLGKFLDREDYENAVNCVRKIGKEALTENGRPGPITPLIRSKFSPPLK